jgi:Uma2 family endonuclease
MSTTPKAPPITVEQYLAFEEPPGYRSELLHGEIILSPDPKPIHHDVAENVFELLKKQVGPNYKVCMRINVNFSAEFYMPSPDVFVIERSIWRHFRERNEYPEGKLILAVEVVSPSNRVENVLDKTSLYLRNGTLEVWNIYPFERRFTVHKLSEQSEYKEGSMVKLPSPLPQVILDSKNFFQSD